MNRKQSALLITVTLFVCQKGTRQQTACSSAILVSIHRQAESENPNFQHNQRKSISQLLSFQLIPCGHIQQSLA